MKTEQLIGDLLMQHSCVIIPSFGGFVTKRVGAQVDLSSGRMLPPSKSILFNIQLIQNDGLLVNEIAQRNSISFDSANDQLDAEVLQWREDLKAGKRIELERVGSLFLDAEKNLCFEQDRLSNLLMESFGLTTVKFLSKEDVKQVQKKVIEETPIIPFEPVVSTEKIFSEKRDIKLPEIKIEEPTIVVAKKKNGWKYAAAACLLPIAFYSIWIPTQTQFLESGLLSWRDFNPFYEQKSATYVENDLALPEKEILEIPSFEEQLANASNADVTAFPFQFDEDTYVLVKMKQNDSNFVETNDNSEIDVVESVEPEPTNPVEITPQKFEFVVGCFSVEANAKSLVQELQKNGMEAHIVDIKNGLHRVSAGGAISIEKIQEIKQNASNAGYSGWILK